MFFAKSPYDSKEIIGQTPKPHDSDEEEYEYGDEDFSKYYRQENQAQPNNLNQNKSVIIESQTHPKENELNKSAMIIDNNLLGEFLNSKSNFGFQEESPEKRLSN
mmetsp:Transcript_13094/g.11576  ORF Transcript_13094/g.11576 Transcript_13094/m.11576 type:complete len:105 (+) Transcript_13094:638-952(+)